MLASANVHFSGFVRFGHLFNKFAAGFEIDHHFCGLLLIKNGNCCRMSIIPESI
jgi:hypothetical protein